QSMKTAAIEDRVSGIDPARRRQPLPRRADICVSDLVIMKVLAREGAVVALGPIMDWDVRLDLLLFTQPVQHGRRPVGRIGGEPLRLEAQALFGALQHGSCGAHFGLADRARGFNIHDHATLDVDQIVVGISEERRPFEGASPLRRWSEGDTNLGCTSVAAPNAASLSVARYSFTARLAAAGSICFFHSTPGIER